MLVFSFYTISLSFLASCGLFQTLQGKKYARPFWVKPDLFQFYYHMLPVISLSLLLPLANSSLLPTPASCRLQPLSNSNRSHLLIGAPLPTSPISISRYHVSRTPTQFIFIRGSLVKGAIRGPFCSIRRASVAPLINIGPFGLHYEYPN